MDEDEMRFEAQEIAKSNARDEFLMCMSEEDLMQEYIEDFGNVNDFKLSPQYKNPDLSYLEALREFIDNAEYEEDYDEYINMRCEEYYDIQYG